MPCGSSQRPFNKWCGVNFPNVECLCEEQTDYIKGMVNDIGNSLIFQLFPQMSLMNVTEGLHLHDHGGGLHNFRGHKERSSWPVEQNRSCSNNSTYWRRTDSARLCVKWMDQHDSYGLWHLHLSHSIFGISAFCFEEFGPSVICHAMFLGLVWQILWTCCIQNKVGNWKPQVGRVPVAGL